MKTVLLILSIFSVCHVLGQSASFKEVKMKPDPKTKEPDIIFPIIVTKNPQVDRLMNLKVKNDILFPEDEKQSLENVLKQNIRESGLVNLSYEVTYNREGVLSFFIFQEGCGAYCSSWRTYFNFDLKTGKEITISDLFLPSEFDGFKNIVQTDKLKTLSSYKEEKLQELKNKDADSSTHEWSLSQVERCMESISIEKFSISANSLEIIDDCEFPHAIRSQQPEMELKYTFKAINKLLNSRFAVLLK